jgi:hypothetical protein
VTVQIPAETGNQFTRSSAFGEKLQEILSSHKAQHALFYSYDGQRCCQYVTECTDPAKVPSLLEPWWHMLKAKTDVRPCMYQEDLQKAAPDVAAAAKKYGS